MEALSFQQLMLVESAYAIAGMAVSLFEGWLLNTVDVCLIRDSQPQGTLAAYGPTTWLEER